MTRPSHSSSQRLRLLLLGVTCASTLILGLLVQEAHFSAHAMDMAATCATKQTVALCEQQNPTVQGCNKDAHSTQVQLVFTPQNQLIGEVDLRRSARCNTVWVRAIAYAHRQGPQVQEIQATIAFSDRIVTTTATQTTQGDKALFAVTRMQFVPPKMVPSRTVVFHLAGAFPSTITVPLTRFPPVVVKPGAAVAPRARGVCASSPSEQHCRGQDPVAQGCEADARTIGFLNLFDAHHQTQSRLELRSSSRCQSSWGQISQPANQHAPLHLLIAEGPPQDGAGPLLKSPMIFTPHLSQVPSVEGDISQNGIPFGQQGSAGLEAVLAAPCTR